ncbi:calcium-binding protein [Pseudogemmobacter bohemicus]|uniref:calcium-binding protein n=1 Tax=Pseudogemmobacter bohemicus TaxID=2250708 RepID=UPI000DD3DC11|nr:calcium-binding protein [Pseudogemmobacter bohemicus]
MSADDFLNFVKIYNNGNSSFTAAVESAIRFFYTSPTMAEKLDARILLGHDLNIVYTYNTAGVSEDQISIAIDHEDDTPGIFINQNGQLRFGNFTQSLLHELIHTLTFPNTLDPPSDAVEYSDLRGPVVDLENSVWLQLSGIDIRTGYYGASAPHLEGYEDLINATFSNLGHKIDGSVFLPSAHLSIVNNEVNLVVGSNSDHEIYGGTNTDIIFDGSGNSILSGGIGNDFIFGGGGVDEIFGGDGNDIIAGGGGRDYLNGDADNDIIYADYYDTLPRDENGGRQIWGGSGFDVLIFGNPIITPLQPITHANLESMPLVLTSGIQDGSISGFEAIYLGSGNDIISSDGSATTILAGGAGNDTFIIDAAGNSPTIVWGGTGADTINIEINDGNPNTNAGILVINAPNINSGNFYLLDTNMLGLDASFDWTTIDLILINPDASDVVNIVRSGISTTIYNSPYITTIERPYLDSDGNPILDEQGLPIIEEYGTIISEGYQGVTTTWTTGGFISGYTGNVFAPALQYEHIVRIIEYWQRPPDDPNVLATPGEQGSFVIVGALYDDEGNIIGHQFYDDPILSQSTIGLGGSGWNFEFDTEYDLSTALYTSNWVDMEGLDATYTREHYFAEEMDDTIVDWFIIGGSISGTTFSGGISVTIPDPSSSGITSGPRGGSYQQGNQGSNTQSGNGVTNYVNYNVARNIVSFDGNIITADNAPNGTTVSEIDGSVVIHHGGDDYTVLRGVTLAAWSAATATQILGDASNNALSGTSGNNVIASGGGNDTLTGGDGDDLFIYTSGNDTIVGNNNNKGNDTLDLSRYAASDVTFTVSGNHVIITTPDGTITLEDQVRNEIGNFRSNIEVIAFRNGTIDETEIRERAISDQITEGNDYVTGTPFNDIFEGSTGNDTILGGNGNDTFYYQSGHDTILGHGNNGGFDTLILDQYTASEVTFGISGTDVIITTPDGSITLNHQVRNSLTDTRSNIENLVFSDVSLNDSEIRARAVSDQGTTGNDTIIATSYDDIIIGRGGNDTLNSGNGNDTFVFVTGDGTDSITDFSLSNDRLRFIDLDYTDLVITQSGSNTIIAYGDVDTIILSNVTATSLTLSHFGFV